MDWLKQNTNRKYNNNDCTASYVGTLQCGKQAGQGYGPGA